MKTKYHQYNIQIYELFLFTVSIDDGTSDDAIINNNTEIHVALAPPVQRVAQVHYVSKLELLPRSLNKDTYFHLFLS